MLLNASLCGATTSHLFLFLAAHVVIGRERLLVKLDGFFYHFWSLKKEFNESFKEKNSTTFLTFLPFSKDLRIAHYVAFVASAIV